MRSLVTTKGGIDASTEAEPEAAAHRQRRRRLFIRRHDLVTLLSWPRFLGTITVACALSAKVGYCNHSCAPWSSVARFRG